MMFSFNNRYVPLKRALINFFDFSIRFKLVIFSITLSGLFLSALAQATVPQIGDLSIYSAGNAVDKSPTIMLVLEASTLTNLADGIGEQTDDSDVVNIVTWSDTVPRYKRFGYYASLSNAGGQGESKLYPSRLTIMKDALFYLMDTPGLLPDDYRIGLTRYSGGTAVKDNPRMNGDGHTANVVAAAKRLGPVITNYEFVANSQGNFVKDKNNRYIAIQQQKYDKVYGSNSFYPVNTGSWVKKQGIYYKQRGSKFIPSAEGNFVQDGKSIRAVSTQDFIRFRRSSGYDVDPDYTKLPYANRLQTYRRTCSGTDADGNRVEYSHRCTIKKLVAAMCDANVRCTGSAPMASAYSEAGAYMMGTKTSSLVHRPDNIPADNIIYLRALRQHQVTGAWQYCLPEYRKIFSYTFTQDNEQRTLYRLECPETVSVINDLGKEVEKNAWVDVDENNIANYKWAGADNEANAEELRQINNKRQYDLLWNEEYISPYGSTNNSTIKISPIDLSFKKYAFSEDSDLPFKKVTSSSQAFIDEDYTYWIDDNAEIQSGLYLEALHRAFRRSRDIPLVKDHHWQYCPPEKAKLINYDVASYRLMCDEADWVDISKNTLSDIKLDGRTKEDGTVLNQVTVEWDCGSTGSCKHINQPVGVNSMIKSDLSHANHLFVVDANQSPYNGWEYFYNANHNTTIAVPPMLSAASGYHASSIRNSPPQVRQHQSYLYQQPSYSSCSGAIQYDSGGNSIGAGAQKVENAILFITSGKPFMDATYAAPTNEMNMSLTRATENSLAPIDGGITCPTNGEGLDGAMGGGNLQNNFWCEIGEYAKRLSQANKSHSGQYRNPANIPVKTGVFLFARPKVSEKLTATSNSTAKGVSYKCANAEDKSIENACLLGQDGEGYGEGGFFVSTSNNPNKSYKELANAIIEMAGNLSADMGVLPTSMPIMPTDPMHPDRLLSHGYMPLIQPKTGSSQALWQGNLRKYSRSASGFTDEQGISPFSTNNTALLSISTRDLWAKEATPYLSSQQAGGAYSQIPMPTMATSATPRNVFINKANSNELTRYTPSNIDTLKITGVPENELRTLMLNYMGYKLADYQTGITTLEQVMKSYSSGSNKSLGGVYHSTPIALIPKVSSENFSEATTTSATLASDTYKYRQQFILFGAMDNALHVVNDNTGEEIFSFFPQEVLAHNGQYKAITPKLNATSEDAKPSFGVDGPWTAYATYDYKREGDKVDETTIIADNLFVYGGARLGARAYYGLDLTGLDKFKNASNLNGFAPKQLFRITPNTEGFERLGYTWAKPVITEINWQGQRRLVAILSGGYDASEYDKTDGQRLNDGIKNSTLGNAIYIVDAKTGKPLVIATQGGTENPDFSSASDINQTVKAYHSHLKFSITGAVKTLDRDNDELTDHLYFADLNGQVFRMDIDNIASAPAIESSTAVNTRVRVVRLADLNNTTLAVKDRIAPRFYETPTVTIQQANRPYGNQRFTTVSVASGDRSNPLDIADPSAETAALKINYIDKDGDERTLIAHRKIDTNRFDKQSWVADSSFPTDGSLNVDSLVNGSLKIPASARKSGTPITATTTFLSTETAYSQLNANNQHKKSSPLAPDIVASSDGSATITLMNTKAVSEGLKTPNYVYTIYDKDVGSINVFSTPSKNLRTINKSYSSTEFPTTTNSMVTSDYSKSGWRAPLNVYGLGLNNTSNAIKAIGPTSAVANKLYVSAYNPNDGQTDMSGCRAQVIGSTEIYQFCLPYGICDEGTYSMPFQRIRYGKGLLPLSWSAGTDGLDRQLITQEQYVTVEDESSNQQSTVQTVAQLNSVNGNVAPVLAQDFGLQGVLKPLLWFDYSRYVPE